MAIDIDDLPEYGSQIKEAFFSQDEWDIAKEFLDSNGVINPIKDKLTSSLSALDVTKMNIDTNFSPSQIQNLITTMPPVSLNFTQDIRNNLINTLTDLSSMVSNVNIDGLLSKTTSFMNHTNGLTQHFPSLLSSANQVFSLPKSIPSDIPNGLPTDFPGIPDLKGVTGFSGFNGLPSLEFLNLPSIPSIDGLPNIEDITGLNLPGIPDSTEIINSLAGSIMPSSLGGISDKIMDALGPMTEGLKNGFSSLGPHFEPIKSAILSGNPNQLSIEAINHMPAINNIIPDMNVLASGVNDLTTKMDDMANSEKKCLFGTACATFEPDDGATQCNSPAKALANASILKRNSGFKTGATLIKAVTSDKVKSILNLD